MQYGVVHKGTTQLPVYVSESAYMYTYTVWQHPYMLSIHVVATLLNMLSIATAIFRVVNYV